MRLDELCAKDKRAIAAGQTTVPRVRLSRPATSSPAAGRGNRWTCHTCGADFTAWAKAQRHADTHGGARLELDIGRRA
jgi:transposase-like protein